MAVMTRREQEWDKWCAHNVLFLDLHSGYMDIFVKVHQSIPYDLNCTYYTLKSDDVNF